MPRIFSKYRNFNKLISMDKLVTRQDAIVGGENGIEPKKDAFL